MNRFRRLLIRWEKDIDNYLAMLHLACAWITFRSAGVFG
ncbi:MAG: IS5/IS1182 family transposase, partial [Chloroflexota bacterium]